MGSGRRFVLKALRTPEARQVVLLTLTHLSQGLVSAQMLDAVADTTIEALRDAVREEPASALACNAVAAQGGARKPRLCVREADHDGRHRYKEPPHGKRWALPGPRAVS